MESLISCLGCWHIYSKIIIFANCFCNSVFLLALNSHWHHQFLLNSLAEHTKGHRNTWNIWCQERKYQKSSRNSFYWYKSTFSKQILFACKNHIKVLWSKLHIWLHISLHVCAPWLSSQLALNLFINHYFTSWEMFRSSRGLFLCGEQPVQDLLVFH